MYQNKKIVPIVTADTEQFDNDQSFSFSPEYHLFKKLYKFPEDYDSSSINNYFVQNQATYPLNRGYSSRYESAPLTLQWLKADKENISTHIEYWLKYSIPWYRRRNSYSNDPVRNHAFLSHMHYDWNTHTEILNSTNYFPILIEQDSFVHKEYYKWYFNLSQSAKLSISSVTPDFVIHSTEDIQFVLWRKLNYAYTHQQADETLINIYSNFSSGIFKELKDSILNYDLESKTFTNLPIKISSHQPNIPQNRAYYRNNNNLIKNLQSRITLGEGFDISFVKNSVNQDLYCDLIRNSSRKRFNVIKVPSWKTKSSDKEISITSYTRSQCLKRQTSFMGFVDVVNCLISPTETSTRNVFNLVSTSDANDLASSSRALKKLIEFMQALIWKDGIKIYAPEKVAEIYAEIYAGLNVYSDVCCSQLSTHHLELLTQLNLDKTDVFDFRKNQVLTAEPKVNLSLKNKYTKISTLYNQNLNLIANPKIKEQSRHARASYRDFKIQQERVLRIQQEISDYIDSLSSSIKEVFNSANFIKANKNLFTSIENKYLNAYNESLKQSSYSLDAFFNNLTENKIHIVSISFYPKGNEGRLKTISSSSDETAVLDFIKAKNFNSNFQILNLEFIIDTPVKIKIDSKEKYVAAGPYKVKCDQNNIYISLLRKESLFGYSEGTYAIHPHTSTINSPTQLFQYTRGCLGEATSLLYNAFKKNDLKLIILSAMTWVTSANSSDPWGRKYSWFPELSDLKEISDQPDVPEEDVTEEDVDSFLTSVCEETLQETSEPELPQQNILTELEETFVSDQPDSPQNIEITPETEQGRQPRWNPDTFSDQPENYIPAFPANTNS